MTLLHDRSGKHVWLNVAVVALTLLGAAATALGAFVLAGSLGSEETAYGHSSGSVGMDVGSASAAVGANATVTIVLHDVPADQMIGYAFSIAYNDAALTRTTGTTGGCLFGMGGVPAAPTGPSPFSSACVNLPVPGTPTNACSPGPCTLATLVVTCNSGGVFPLDLDETTSAYADSTVTEVIVPATDGQITCIAPPTPTSTSTLTPTGTPTPCPGGVCPSPTPTNTSTPTYTPTVTPTGTPPATPVSGCPSLPTFSFSVVDPTGDAFDAFGFGTPIHDITSVAGVGDATTFCLTVSFAGPVSPADATDGNQVAGFIDFDTDQDPTTGVSSFQNTFCPNQNTGMGVDATLFMFQVSGGLGQIGVDYVPVVFGAQSFTAVIPLSEIGGDSSFNVGMVLGSFDQPTDCAPGNGGCIEAPAGTICVPPSASLTDLLLLNADIVNAVTGGVFDLTIADGDAPDPVDSALADCTGAVGFVCGVKEFEQFVGNGNGVLTSAEVAASGVDIDDNQLTASTGLLVALAFVSNDLAVNITLSNGSFVQSQVAVLVCNQAPPSPPPAIAAPMGDNDCDNNVGTVGDGVVAAAISGAGATVGARSITATQGTTSQAVDFMVVGGPNSLELTADESTVTAPGLTACTLTAAGSASDIVVLHALVFDANGTALTGVSVLFTSSALARVKVAAASVLTADNGSENEAANRACGNTATGQAMITAAVCLALCSTESPVLSSRSVIVTAVGVPAQVDLQADPAQIACDGTASSTVTATVTDSAGANVADGTAVTFSVVALGTANPINATTKAGVATSNITPLSGAVQGVTVIVTAGSVQNSLQIFCSLPIPCSGNDDFEDGSPDSNQIPCWIVVDQPGSFGSWCTQAGTILPQGICSGGFVAIAPPPQGSKAAMTNQSGPGTHVLYRCGTLGSGAISFQLYLNNTAGAFYSPNTLSFNDGQPNQQFRADLVTAAGVASDSFSVAAGDVLMNLYVTQPGDPPVSGYTLVARDASAFIGVQTCLRFAEVDNQLFFHAGIDDVQIDLRGPATPPPTPTATRTPTATATTPAAVAPAVVVAPPAPTRTATSVPATATAVPPTATPASAVLPAAIRAPDTGFGQRGVEQHNYWAIALLLVLAGGGMIAAVAYQRRRG